MAAYGSELSRLVDELNRSTAATRTGEGASIDRLLALAVQRGASDVILVAGSGIALRVKGSLTQPGRQAIVIGRASQPAAAAAHRAPGRGIRDQQVAGFLFRARLHRPVPGQLPLSARDAGGQHSFAACADSLARVAAPASRTGAIGRTPARFSAAHRSYRLWQDLDPGCACST